MATGDAGTILGPSAPGVRTMTTFSLIIMMEDSTGAQVQVGTLSDFSPGHKRTNKPIGGIGIGDRRLEIVPGVSSYTISMVKVAFWDKALSEVFGYSATIRMIAEMQKPFDIYVKHLNPSATTNKGSGVINGAPDVIETVYRKCVISSWDRTQRWGDDVTITDKVDCDVTYIDSNTPDPLQTLFNLVV